MGKSESRPGLPAGLRKRQALATKGKLFDAAISLFREKGFDYVTIDEIVEKAGTAKGTFYTYFNTKSDVIIEEFRDIDTFYERSVGRLQKLDSAKEKLVQFTRAQCRYIKTRIGADTVKVLYANQLGNVTTERILVNPERPLVRIVTRFISEGQQNGEFRRDISATELSLWMNRAMRGLFLDWGIRDADVDLVRHGMRYFERFIVPALVGSEEAW